MNVSRSQKESFHYLGDCQEIKTLHISPITTRGTWVLNIGELCPSSRWSILSTPPTRSITPGLMSHIVTTSTEECLPVEPLGKFYDQIFKYKTEIFWKTLFYRQMRNPSFDKETTSESKMDNCYFNKCKSMNS